MATEWLTHLLADVTSWRFYSGPGVLKWTRFCFRIEPFRTGNRAGARVRSFDLTNEATTNGWNGKIRTVPGLQKQLRTALILSATFIWSYPWVGLWSSFLQPERSKPNLTIIEWGWAWYIQSALNAELQNVSTSCPSCVQNPTKTDWCL